MMDNNQLISIIRQYRDDSLGADQGELANDRAEAMNRYHGRPYGDEKEGRSSIVSRDLSEAVDWAMPAIMGVFTQSGQVAEFSPVGPEDVQLAQQDSDYVNHVIMNDNAGFMVLHDTFKDTLLLRNGYVKHYWDTSEKVEEVSFTGLLLDQLQTIVTQYEQAGQSVEIIGQEQEDVEINGQTIPLFDIRLKLTREIGKCIVEAVPPEEVRVSKRCRGSLQEAVFVEHVTRKTRSQLIEMGMPRDFVDQLSPTDERPGNSQAYYRDTVSDENGNSGHSGNDRAMDEIEYCEAYILVDYDGDGIAERRLVVTCNDEIPPGEQFNRPISAVPMTGFVCKRVPHRHVGESLNDELEDLARIMTTLKRQLLDNIYFTNNSELVANERVNLRDLADSRPGGIKRVQGLDPVSGAIEPLVKAPIVNEIMGVLGFMNEAKEMRTGVSRMSSGLDPDSLRQSTKGAFLENLNRASRKIEMMTRMLAESGVKDMVLQVHGILRENQNVGRMVQMRGTWVQVNPSEWKERTDVTVKVGLGTGNSEEKREKLLLLSQLQDKAAQFGLVDPPQVYALFDDLAKTMGFDVPGKYLLSPTSPEFAQKAQNPPQNPMLQVEQMKLQAKQVETQGKMQLEAQKAQQNMMQERARSENDIAIEREKIAAQMELERYKAQLQAETQIRMKQMELAAQAMQPAPVEPVGVTQ